MKSKITIADLFEAKRNNKKIVCVSCYDYTTARMVEKSGADMVLVGDSAAQVLLGHKSTLPASMDFMVEITAAVGRGAQGLCLVADMPFLSYNTGLSDAVRNAGRFVAQAGADIIKIESTRAQVDVIKAVRDAGMAVMAHVGIRPQSISKMGRFKAEATTAQMAYELLSLCEEVTCAGASCLLLEGTATEAAAIVTKESDLPVISCGSGGGCDGQVLIAPDILGITEDVTPKFVKSYGDIGEQTVSAFEKYGAEIREGIFPDDAHSYHMKKGEIDKLRDMIEGDFKQS